MKVILFANTDWYLYNFRLALAKYLRDQQFDVVMVSPPGPYGPKLEAQGFRWIALEMNRRSLNPLGELAVLHRLSAVYAAERPDVVHHFTIKCVIYGSLIARMLGIRRQINAITGLGHVFCDDRTRNRLLRPLVRALMRLALATRGSRLILQNPDDMTAIVSAGLASECGTFLIRGSGVDTERFQPSSGGDEPTMRVLLASRLLWDKGIREYIEAARVLRDSGIPATFLLAGRPDSGNPASVPDAQVRHWHEQKVIEYLGHVEDMPTLLRAVHVVVLPSYREGAPRSLLEAAACGLPVIATDVPGCREVVQHGVNGLLVPPRDPAALARAMRQLYEHPDLRRRMGAAGRETVLREFNQKRVLEETFAVYQQLLTASV